MPGRPGWASSGHRLSQAGAVQDRDRRWGCRTSCRDEARAPLLAGRRRSWAPGVWATGRVMMSTGSSFPANFIPGTSTQLKNALN